jgi:DNA topoisomerase-1
MNLVIVESPSKAKTINKYLGKDFKVISSYGHIRDLPSKNGSVEPDKDFKMHYTVSDKSIKQVKQIVQDCKGIKKLYLATDPDREGEAIAWHIVEVLKEKKAIKKDVEVKRIVFHEITKKAVTEAIDNPREISMDLVNAQQARRALDYLVGFNLSPVLWRKLPGSRSAGRVQSVALRLISDREAEIERFVEQEYWSVKCNLDANKKEFLASLISIKGKKLGKFDLPDKESVKPVVEDLESSTFKVSSIENKQQKRNPYPPFITSTLQQDASNRLGFGAKKTMMVAQKLYEGINLEGDTVGLITYMRTDGVYMSQTSVDDIRNHVSEQYGQKYLPEKARVYKSKSKNAQEAHEAIRPTNVSLTPSKVSKFLDADQLKLYELIWRRAVACQMSSAVLDQRHVTIENNKKSLELKAVGTVILFDGFYKVYKTKLANSEDSKEDKESLLPEMEEGQSLGLLKILPEQHFTAPPPRYSEASLVKKLEELGIGRPSTYASIISVLADRDYVKIENRRFFPEERGIIVTAFLMSFFEKYVEYDFTASLEEKLDKVSDGKMEWKAVMEEFWGDFNKNVKAAYEYSIEDVIKAIEPLIERHVFPKTEDGSDPKKCPECDDGVLQVRIAKFGPFVSCNKYPDCKYTRQLDLYDEPGGREDHKPTERVLGEDPASGLEVFLKKGPYGFYIQLAKSDSEHMKRVPLPKFINDEELDLELALSLLLLPRELGVHPESGELIKAGIGKYGPYLFHQKQYISLKDPKEIFSISLDKAIELIDNNPNKGKDLGDHKEEPILLMKGKYGPYIKYSNRNYKIPKETDSETLSLERAIELISAAGPPKGKGKWKKKS